MAKPWQPHTTKSVDGITHQPRARLNHAFAAPTPQRRVTFTRAELSASMAMTSVLSGFPGNAAISLAHAMSQLVTDHVDDDPPDDLQFQASVGGLADSARSFFSSCIGAGMADRYALALGYRFRCNSRELIRTGRAGDFLYDGPPVPPYSAVMVEAKGSLQANLRHTAFWNIVEQGYIGQVEPHLGKSYSLTDRTALNIVHGYAVGCAAQVPLSNAIGHVVETANAGGSGQRPDLDHSQGSSPDVTLGNYQAVAELLGDREFTGIIEMARFGERWKRPRRFRTLQRITFRKEPFVRFESESWQNHLIGSEHDRARLPRPQFAIWKPIFDVLLQNLSELPEIWEMPAVPGALLADEAEDGGAVLPDGLALLPPWFELQDTSSGRLFNDPPALYEQVQFKKYKRLQIDDDEREQEAKRSLRTLFDDDLTR